MLSLHVNIYFRDLNSTFISLSQKGQVSEYENNVDIHTMKYHPTYCYLQKARQLYYYYYYYYLFTAIGFAPGGSGPYTTQLQQNTHDKNKYIP
jgi:hypothetical protein